MQRKKIITFIFSALFLFILGSSFTFLMLSMSKICSFGKFSSEHWGLVTTCSFIALFLTHLYYIKLERQGARMDQEKDHHEMEEMNLESSNLRNDFERFKRNSLHVIKAHLKTSILFWIRSCKRDQKTFDEAKKEIFRELSREISGVSWMDEMLEELKREVSRHKGDFDKPHFPTNNQPEDNK